MVQNILGPVEGQVISLPCNDEFCVVSVVEPIKNGGTYNKYGYEFSLYTHTSVHTWEHL